MYSARKIIAVLLVAVMVFAMGANAFAASYSDLEGRWSKTFMEDLADRGILSGYSDGTMRPGKEISGAESLAFLANIYKLNDKEKAAVLADFGAKAKAVTSAEWIQNAAAVCMAAGIVTESELKGIKLDKPLPREQFILYLVRAIQMDDTAAALAEAELSFPDAEDVSDECHGSVALLSQLKIVNGNASGKLLPQGSVTRETCAAMVSQSLTYLESNGDVLKIAGYSGLDDVEGLLASVSTKGVTLKDNAGVERFYKTASGFMVTVNGATKALSTSHVGNYAKLRLVEGVANGAEIETEAKTEYITGSLVNTVTGNENIRVFDYLTDTTKYYNVMQATITFNGAETPMSKVEKGSYLVMKNEDGVITEVKASNKIEVVEGEIASIEYGTPVVINVTEASGETAVLRLLLSDLPVIKRGNTEVGVDKLAKGDVIKATFKGGYVSEISMDVTTATLSGTLTAISQTVDATTWIITRADGTISGNTLAKNVVAYSGKNVIKLSAISVGDEISVVVIDGAITEITLDKAHTSSGVSTPEMITVEVLNVDTSERKLAVLTEENKLLYIDCSVVGEIATAAGSRISLSGLTVGDKVFVWGSYNENGEFTAKTIVVVEKQ